MAVDGTYKIVMTTPMGDRPATVALVADGGALSGTFGGDQGSLPFAGGTTSGDDVSWSATINGAMGEMKLDFAGKVSGDTLAGTVQFGAFGSGAFTGTRV